MPAVVIEDVHKRFGPIEVLKGVSLSVEAGQVVAIIGRSGSGKSTLLRCINGLEICQSGRIEVVGHVLDQDQKRLRELREVGLQERADDRGADACDEQLETLETLILVFDQGIALGEAREQV